MKEGYKTTEFWISLLVVVGGAVTSSGMFSADEPWVRLVSSVCAALAAMYYTKARKDVKVA